MGVFLANMDLHRWRQAACIGEETMARQSDSVIAVFPDHRAAEGALALGGLSALGAALVGIGIPKGSVIKYETAVSASLT
jgi:hypothetical protein